MVTFPHPAFYLPRRTRDPRGRLHIHQEGLQTIWKVFLVRRGFSFTVSLSNAPPPSILFHFFSPSDWHGTTRACEMEMVINISTMLSPLPSSARWGLARAGLVTPCAWLQAAEIMSDLRVSFFLSGPIHIACSDAAFWLHCNVIKHTDDSGYSVKFGLVTL